MKKYFNKAWALILSLTLLISSFAFASSAQASQSKSKTESPALVSSVTHYEIDYRTKKWTKQSVAKYQYKNGYPVKIYVKETYADDADITALSYSFRENKLPLKMTSKSSSGVRTVKYNSKGARYYDVIESEYLTLKKYFQFAENKSYFTAVLHDGKYYGEDGKTIDSTMEETDSISVTLKNGLLKKTINTGMYANVNAGDKKTWQRFNGTYRADYDENGILKETSAKFRMGASGKQNSFVVKRKNGRIISVVRRRWVAATKGKKAHWEDEEKIVFKYTDKKIDKKRYAMMINEAIIGSDNNYYFYNWY